MRTLRQSSSPSESSSDKILSSSPCDSPAMFQAHMQCLQVYGFILFLYGITCKNVECGKSGEKYESRGSESDGPYWSSIAVLLILASNTKVCLPSSDTESQLGYNNAALRVYI